MRPGGADDSGAALLGVRPDGRRLPAPIVAAAAAQVLAVHPDWTPDEVKGAFVVRRVVGRRILGRRLVGGRVVGGLALLEERD